MCEWYPFLCDAHCHAHDDKQRLDEIQQLRTGHVTLMGVRQDDWETVEKVAAASNIGSNDDTTTDMDSLSRCVPCFGIHPWYVYRLAPPQEEDPLANEDEVKQQHYQHVLMGRTIQKSNNSSHNSRHPFLFPTGTHTWNNS
ncbi:unnamed protein product [Absidia cylindrospora]